MNYKVIMVPKKWSHPRVKNSKKYIPLLQGNYKDDVEQFNKIANERGLQTAVEKLGCPDKNLYMPNWPDSERTHYMMYEMDEDCPRGIPRTPAFNSVEELAIWLAGNDASVLTATPIQDEDDEKEAWKQVMRKCNAQLLGRN